MEGIPEGNDHDARHDGVLISARRVIHSTLSLALTDPIQARWSELLGPGLAPLAVAAGQLIRDEPAASVQPHARSELPAGSLDIAAVVAELDRPRNEISAEHTAVFGLTSGRLCPPYETAYTPQKDPTFRAQQVADVSGYYRAFGLVLSQDAKERHDHASIQLEFMSWLLTKQLHALPRGAEGTEQAHFCHETARRFFTEHLAWWLPAFAKLLDCRAEETGAGFYRALAAALASFVAAERSMLGIPVPDAPAGLQPEADPEPETADADCSSCRLAGPIPSSPHNS